MEEIARDEKGRFVKGQISDKKGKTFEEMYGVEKAKQLKGNHSKKMKGNVSEKMKKHLNKLHKMMRGRIASEETKRKQSLSMKGKKHSLKTIEIIKKARQKQTGLLEPHLGKHHSKETKDKLRIISTGNKYNLGKKRTAESNEKNRLAHLGKRHTEEHKRNIGLGNTGRKQSQNMKELLRLANTGRKRTPETRKKQREKRIKYIEYSKNNGMPIHPAVGRQETQILDFFETECLGYPIIRQYRFHGYFLDGYCPALNLAIEVDEKHHSRRIQKDIERENYIKSKLGCQFIRIPS